jgi:hypothetical protein
MVIGLLRNGDRIQQEYANEFLRKAELAATRSDTELSQLTIAELQEPEVQRSVNGVSSACIAIRRNSWGPSSADRLA